MTLRHREGIINRRTVLSGVLAGAAPAVKAGDVPMTRFGRTGVKGSVIAQGGARMDLHPDIPAAAEHVRNMNELGMTYFDCARLYWNGRSEEAYGIGLQGVRKNVFLTTKSAARTAKDGILFGR